MHIAFLLPDMRGGGAQHMIINMANEFGRRGHKVTLFVLQDEGPYRHKIGGHVNVIHYQCSRSLDAFLPFVRDLKKIAPDVLYSAMTYMNVTAILAKFFSAQFNMPVIISERNYFSLNANQDGSPPTLKQKICVGLLYPLASKIVGISNGVAGDIKKYLFAGKDKVVFIHNPVVSEDTLTQLSSIKPDPRLEKATKPCYVTSARFVKQKDQKTLLKAFAQVVGKRPASLIMLGEGPLQGELKDYAVTMGIADHISFMGFVTDPLSIMAQADVFVLSSAWEGFGNVIVEALLCGLPVVSTDCPSGPSEILEGGKYGILVPVGDDAKLAEAMEAALDGRFSPDNQKVRAMDFSVSKICDQYEVLFQSIKKAKL